MPRKNTRAGQPNRYAQMNRKVKRIETKARDKDREYNKEKAVSK